MRRKLAHRVGAGRMGIVHVPRTVGAVVKGLAKRQLSPLSSAEKSVVGVGLNNPPHVYTSRAGLFDVDLMLHMNNASYLTHAELARWEWSAFNGTLGASVQTKSAFIVAASMIRFRREIKPLNKFDIETRLVGIDDRNLWVYQTFHHDEAGERGKVLAQVYTQAVMTKLGRGVINPRTWLKENIPEAKDALEDLAVAHGEVGSIFDEKAERFTNLEQVLRRSAAVRDDEVAK